MKLIHKKITKPKIFYLGLITIISIAAVAAIIHIKNYYIEEISVEALVPNATSTETSTMSSTSLFVKYGNTYTEVGTLNQPINLTIDQYNDEYAHIENTNYYVPSNILIDGYVKLDNVSSANFRSIDTYETTKEYDVYAQGSNKQLGTIAEGQELEVLGYDGSILYIDWFDYLAYIDIEEPATKYVSDTPIVNTTDINYVYATFDNYTDLQFDTCTYNLSTLSLIKSNKVKNICPTITSNFIVVDETTSEWVLETLNSFDAYKYKGTYIMPYDVYALLNQDYYYAEAYPIDSDLIPEEYTGIKFTQDNTKCNLKDYVCY